MGKLRFHELDHNKVMRYAEDASEATWDESSCQHMFLLPTFFLRRVVPISKPRERDRGAPWHWRESRDWRYKGEGGSWQGTTMRASRFLIAAASLVSLLLLLLLPASLGFASEEALESEREGGGNDLQIGMALTGGIMDVEGSENSAETEELARFAVEEHNKKENALLEFSRVVKAKEQVVSGMMHHLTVEVIEGGKKKLYEAKVWVQAWLNSKKLHEFSPVDDSSSISPADLGVKRDPHEPGWREVPAHDPVVQDAASHAVKTIQQRSNSLYPYELLQILRAKAEVVEDLAKFDLLLKLKRGSKEEKFKVEVHKNIEGNFLLNQMEQDHSDPGN